MAKTIPAPTGKTPAPAKMKAPAKGKATPVAQPKHAPAKVGQRLANWKG